MPNRPAPLFSPPTPPGDDRPLAGLTLLAVEDSRLTCESLRLLCQRGGARLRRAEGLASARAHLRLYRPDLALVDLGLPDGRGEALIAELAAAPRRPALIGMSGEAGAGAAALQAGADAFLEKPLPGLAAFQALVLALVQGRRPAPVCPRSAKARPDPLALRDDLHLAAALLDRRDPAFVAGFVTGLARSSGDPALEAAAAALGPGGQGRERLRGLILRRIGAAGSGLLPHRLQARQPGAQAP